MVQSTIDKEHVFVCLDETPFCDIFYGRPFVVRQHFMKKICQRAGVKPFGFHAIRHLTASILARANVPMVDIQSILRHKKLATTERYIGRLGSLRPSLKVLPGFRKATNGATKEKRAKKSF